MPGTKGQVAAIAVERARRLRSRSRSAGPTAFDRRCVARLGALPPEIEARRAQNERDVRRTAGVNC
jgi:hypothetical protein